MQYRNLDADELLQLRRTGKAASLRAWTDKRNPFGDKTRDVQRRQQKRRRQDIMDSAIQDQNRLQQGLQAQGTLAPLLHASVGGSGILSDEARGQLKSAADMGSRAQSLNWNAMMADLDRFEQHGKRVRGFAGIVRFATRARIHP